MMCERALSRETQGSLLSDKQFVQGYIADSYAQLLQFRLMVLYTAWEIDKYNDYKKVRKDIAAVKVVMPTVLHDIAWRAMQVHGALGVTNEMPFLGHGHRRRRDGAGRRPDRGAQDHGRQAGAAGLPAHRRHLADRVDPRANAKPPGPSTPTTSSTRWATCERADRHRAARRLDGRRGAARQGRAADTPLPVRRHAERHLRATPRRAALRHPHAAAGRTTRPRQGHPARVADHRGARRHRGAAHRGGRRVRRRRRARPAVLPDGLRRRLVSDGHPRQVARAVRQRPERPGPG